MTIKDKLHFLHSYYSQRQLGHTTLVKEGFNHYEGDRFVVVNNMREGGEFKCSNDDVISLNNLDKLRGHKRPIIFDNLAMTTIISESLKTILKQEKIIEELKNQPLPLNYKEYDDLRGRYNTLQREYGILNSSLNAYKVKTSEKIQEINLLKHEIKQLRKYNILIPVRDFFKDLKLWPIK